MQGLGLPKHVGDAPPDVCCLRAREQGDIESNSLMIAPETMDIRCLFPTDKPGKDHIEVVAGD